MRGFIQTNSVTEEEGSTYDDSGAWSADVYRLTADDGTLSACHTNDLASVSMNIQGLTSLFYGLHPLEDLVFRYGVTVPNEEDRRLLNDWFEPCTFFNPYTF